LGIAAGLRTPEWDLRTSVAKAGAMRRLAAAGPRDL